MKLHNSTDMLEPDESIIRVVHRHTIGVIYIFALGFVTIAALMSLFVAISPDAFVNDQATIDFAIVLVAIALAVAAYVYRQSKLIITDRSLVQIIQSTLFIRKASHLSMSNVEDVSAEQRGILPNLFNYGTLMVQTAGERDNFIFKLCPRPNEFADIIIEARQAYAQALKEENERH